MDDFEVIETKEEKDPYPTLLGIDWAYENFVVIDLKKEIMSFKVNGMKVTQPLDPYQGPCYTDPVEGNTKEDPWIISTLRLQESGRILLARLQMAQ